MSILDDFWTNFGVIFGRFSGTLECLFEDCFLLRSLCFLGGLQLLVGADTGMLQMVETLKNAIRITLFEGFVMLPKLLTRCKFQMEIVRFV